MSHEKIGDSAEAGITYRSSATAVQSVLIKVENKEFKIRSVHFILSMIAVAPKGASAQRNPASASNLKTAPCVFSKPCTKLTLHCHGSSLALENQGDSCKLSVAFPPILNSIPIHFPIERSFSSYSYACTLRKSVPGCCYRMLILQKT